MTSVAASSSQNRSRSLPERSALFPVETNEDRPSPRRVASATAAIPNAPLCEANATPPGGGATGANVAFSADVRGGVEHAEAVRADEPHAGRAADVEQLGLAGATARADLCEAGREDHERAHAGGAALARDAARPRSAGTAITASSTGSGTSAIERCAGSAADDVVPRMDDREAAAVAGSAKVAQHRARRPSPRGSRRR